MKQFVLSMQMILTVLSLPVYAADLFSPVGLWKTIDDNSGKPGGLIRIELVDGTYQGRIEKIFPEPGEDPNPKCLKCEGARHNQPVIGLTFMWGLTKQGDEYQGGEILDPKTGKVYRAKLKLEDGGKETQRARVHRVFSPGPNPGLVSRIVSWARFIDTKSKTSPAGAAASKPGGKSTSIRSRRKTEFKI